MNTKCFEQFDVMTDAKLSTVEGGAIKGAVTTYSWQGAALKAVGYGIKAGVAYGATCRWT